MRDEIEKKDILHSRVLLDKEMLEQKSEELQEQIRSQDQAAFFEIDLLHQEIDKLNKEREAFYRNL